MNQNNDDSVFVLGKNIENLFNNSNINLARTESIILLSYFLKLSKEDIILRVKDIYPDQRSIENINLAVKRRLRGEPISHIIGKREFYSIDFDISSDALDPRPDSEILVEEILELVKNFDESKTIKILELGVGSGCLVLTLLKNISNSSAIAVDINQKSIEIAKNNAKKLDLEEKIEFINSNWYENLVEEKFDIIISNPPYIKTEDIAFLQKEVKDFEPIIALDGGEDGFDCYREIAKNINNFLSKKSFLILEIGQNMEKEVSKIFQDKKLKLIKSAKDLNSIIRCLIFVKE